MINDTAIYPQPNGNRTVTHIDKEDGLYRVVHYGIVHFVTTEIGAAQIKADRLAGTQGFVTHSYVS